MEFQVLCDCNKPDCEWCSQEDPVIIDVEFLARL